MRDLFSGGLEAFSPEPYGHPGRGYDPPHTPGEGVIHTTPERLVGVYDA